jgi:hypothetical protein
VIDSQTYFLNVQLQFNGGNAIFIHSRFYTYWNGKTLRNKIVPTVGKILVKGKFFFFLAVL